MKGVQTKKIQGYEIKPPKKSAFQIETAPDQIRLHTLLVASGKRGGGKSVAVSNLCAKLIEQGVLDRVILISPTYFSNR
jgi:Mrp family chromosome partitioning ATPase